MGDWKDTLKDRENGELVGFVGHNEAVEEREEQKAAPDQPITDVRRVAVDDTEAAGVKVADAPVPETNTSQVSSGAGQVESTGGDEGNAGGGEHFENQ